MKEWKVGVVGGGVVGQAMNKMCQGEFLQINKISVGLEPLHFSGSAAPVFSYHMPPRKGEGRREQ